MKMRMVLGLCAVLALTVGVATATAGHGHGKGKGGNSAAAHSCNHGGYKNFTRADGTGFKNTGACVSYAAHGGTLVAKSAAQLACESFGGTFTLGGTYSLGTAVWSCQWTTTDATDFTTKSNTLSTDCFTQAPIGLVFYPNDGGAPVVPGSNKSVCAAA